MLLTVCENAKAVKSRARSYHCRLTLSRRSIPTCSFRVRSANLSTPHPGLYPRMSASTLISQASRIFIEKADIGKALRKLILEGSELLAEQGRSLKGAAQLATSAGLTWDIDSSI